MFDLQVLMTYNHSKNNRKYFVNIFFIFIIFISIILVFIIASKSKNREYFNGNQVFIVYTMKNTSKNLLLAEQSNIKKLGGGGEIYNFGKYYYLTTSVYLSKDDADDVVKNISQTYSNSEIYDLTIKKISKKQKIKILQDKYTDLFFSYFDEFSKKIINMQIDYISENLSNHNILSFIVENKLKLENIIKHFENKDEFYEKISVYQNVLLTYLNNFINSFLESTTKNSLICELAINIQITKYELYNNL